jgi:hypothetical protein
VTVDLATDYQQHKAVLARHGIPISRRLVIEEMAEIVNSNYDPRVIQRVLEASTPRCDARRRNTPLCQLDRALAELELALERIEGFAE